MCILVLTMFQVIKAHKDKFKLTLEQITPLAYLIQQNDIFSPPSNTYVATRPPPTAIGVQQASPIVPELHYLQQRLCFPPARQQRNPCCQFLISHNTHIHMCFNIIILLYQLNNNICLNNPKIHLLGAMQLNLDNHNTQILYLSFNRCSHNLLTIITTIWIQIQART